MRNGSSHYFTSRKRGTQGSRRDALRGRIAEALRVLATVAAEDADYAQIQNGRGFSKSDQEGHALSRVTVEQALADEVLMMKILAMGKRYSRQASAIHQLSLLWDRSIQKTVFVEDSRGVFDAELRRAISKLPK